MSGMLPGDAGPIMARVTAAVPPPVLALLLGALLGLCGLPLPWSVLSVFPLAGLLAHAASARSREGVAGRLFWAGAGYFAVHLWWLTDFLGKIFQFPPAGVLAFALFALEGLFLLAMAYPLTRLVRSPQARVWALAGGWVVLEWTRFLGPLAFPWPTLGYSLLPTPAIQIADLGGVLLGSVLVALSAAALAGLVLGGRGRGRPLIVAALCWAAALAYGLTRTAGEGPVQPVRVLRTSFDSFGRAVGSLSPGEQLQAQLEASAGRQPDEILVWSETALTAPMTDRVLAQFPGPGISGLGTPFGARPQRNSVVSLDAAGRIISRQEKGKLVPFGEYFIFYNGPLRPVYAVIENALNFTLPSFVPASSVQPLRLNGVQYGAYICYDSVFPWVARSLTRQGARLLVNPSNDGWYSGWGVQQHFMMGRVRAIENRRWLVRSVNRGVAGAVNDLGQPVSVVSSGETTQALSVRPKLLTGRTLFNRVGDWPALLLSILMIGYGVRVDRRERS
ncbi:apolipoprotein N-acyltransferase [Deinococcus aerolatus]|uniref:Apolipoprotein N-acyltransferase n=1 Tax=Deinococcus aerolatus TaxID=522487 RepID=A0ABQ2G2F7_9DEIO|nr:apolipoprotein N-acyltransferase [Deinococcus aerolatus]